jgi:hypothetical protein
MNSTLEITNITTDNISASSIASNTISASTSTSTTFSAGIIDTYDLSVTGLIEIGNSQFDAKILAKLFNMLLNDYPELQL